MTIAILPPQTLVCSDAFGLGFTLGRVQRTSACPSGKVDVAFDDDLSCSADEFTGRSRTVENSEGEAVVQRYRIVLCSYLDWDSEDEAEEAEPDVLSDDNDDDKPAEQDELGFDNVEAIEAQADAEEAEAEHVFEFSRVKRGKVFGQWHKKLTRPKTPEASEADEAEPSSDEAALFAEFAAELD